MRNHYNYYMEQKSLSSFMWLSVGAAVITIGLKTAAYFLTGSVGLLSDALESIINLVAAISALFLLKLAEKPPDDDHLYGHTKAEYFSSIIEACLIILAAFSIGYSAFNRLIYPQPIDNTIIGLVVSGVASIINLAVALALLKVGKKHKSITLEADGHHLLTDVWTSVGVIAGVAIVGITHIYILDPLVAIAVAGNILFTGFDLIKKSALGLMDTSLPEEDLQKIKNIIDEYNKKGVSYHGLRTRQSATRSFMSVHLLVPGKLSVQEAHDLSEEIEEKIAAEFQKLTILTHLEPVEDPKSHADISIDRK